MTNRSKSARKPRLRFLDLSFEGQEGETKSVENGGRPHGGVRGTKRNPLGMYSYDKGAEYQKELRDDIDKLITEDILAVHGSPIWSVEVSKESTNSGESPLFTNKVLSPCKLENQYGYIKFNRAMLGSAKSAPPPSRDGISFYRPNRTHQFLTNTELRDHATGDANTKYGKPTRTTLLRARQKGGANPVNAYELRRELMQRLSEIKANALVVNPNEFIQMYNLNDETESLHSFLTGARYNSAHCLDSKSLETCGVYMPRNNPLACFVVRKNKFRDPVSSAPTPPDSPRSDIDETSVPIKPTRPQSAYGSNVTQQNGPPSFRPRSAWVGSTHRRQNGNASESEHSTPHMFQDGITVKGSRMSSAMRSYSEPKLPSVHGISVTKGKKILRNPTDDSFQIHQPPPTPTPREVQPDKAGDEVPGEYPINTESNNKKKKKKPEMVDRCFNVPSIASDDVGNVREFADKPYAGSGVLLGATKDTESVDPKRGSDPVGTEYSTTVNTEFVYRVNGDDQRVHQVSNQITPAKEDSNQLNEDAFDNIGPVDSIGAIEKTAAANAVSDNGVNDNDATENKNNSIIKENDNIDDSDKQTDGVFPKETDCTSVHSVDSGEFEERRTSTVFITEEMEEGGNGIPGVTNGGEEEQKTE